MAAAENGKFDTVKWIVEKNVDLEVKDKYGNTAFLYAATEGHIDIISFLHDKVNIQHQNNFKSTSLICAARKGRTECVKYLFSYGVNLFHQTDDGITALQRAAANGHKDTVECLLNLGANSEVEKDTSYTPLHRAVSYETVDQVSTLLKSGLYNQSITQKDQAGNNLLHHAALGSLSTLKLLFETTNIKSTILETNSYGSTPLHWATFSKIETKEKN